MHNKLQLYLRMIQLIQGQIRIASQKLNAKNIIEIN
jgi:hypothetical protein